MSFRITAAPESSRAPAMYTWVCWLFPTLPAFNPEPLRALKAALCGLNQQAPFPSGFHYADAPAGTGGRGETSQGRNSPHFLPLVTVLLLAFFPARAPLPKCDPSSLALALIALVLCLHLQAGAGNLLKLLLVLLLSLSEPLTLSTPLEISAPWNCQGNC